MWADVWSRGAAEPEDQGASGPFVDIAGPIDPIAPGQRIRVLKEAMGGQNRVAEAVGEARAA